MGTATSTDSTPLSLQTPPSGLDPPTTAYDVATNSVLILWNPPADNGGFSQLTYILQVQDADGLFVTVNQPVECDTTIAPLPDGVLGCRMDISTLTTGLYNLAVGAQVIAEVTASQAIGSCSSLPGGTALIPS